MSKKFFIFLVTIIYFSKAEEAGLDESSEANIDLFSNSSSCKYITRCAFEECANLIFDRHRSFDPEDVKSGDVIFVRGPRLFFSKIHPIIKNPYILITHGDTCDGYKEHEYLQFLNDRKLIAWFGIHPPVKAHPKFHPIPIGIKAFEHLYKNNEQTNGIFAHFRKNAVKTHLLYMNFAVSHRSDRKFLKGLFANKPFCLISDGKPFMDYMAQMATCKFTLSPKGIAPDCYRTWEALFVGSIPIVKSSELNILYKELPILVIDDWNLVTEQFLDQKYLEISKKKYNMERLYIEYWKKRILDAQQKFLKRCRQ